METLLKIQGFYHRTIFDCFVESLQNLIFSKFLQVRLEGRRIEVIGGIHDWSALLEMSKEKVLENAGFLCGVIRDKEDSMIGDLKYIDNFTLFNLREERMIRMIIYSIVTQQREWQEFGFEENKVKEEVARLIERDLLQELASDYLN